MEDITTSLTQVFAILTSCVNFITGNPVLMICFVAGLVPLGFGIFRAAKHAAKN